MRALAVLVIAGCGRLGFDAAPRDASVDAVFDAADAAPDVAPDAGCPAPPANCSRMTCGASTTCYYACTPVVPWSTARDACAAMGGCLVTINDTAENDCIAAAPVGNPWIGLVQTDTMFEPAGGWTWQCGNSSVVNWRAPMEPNNQGGNENCAVSTTDRWVDLVCSSMQPYVCEL